MRTLAKIVEFLGITALVVGCIGLISLLVSSNLVLSVFVTPWGLGIFLSCMIIYVFLNWAISIQDQLILLNSNAEKIITMMNHEDTGEIKNTEEKKFKQIQIEDINIEAEKTPIEPEPKMNQPVENISSATVSSEPNYAPHLKRAMGALKRNSWEEALEFFDAILKKYDSDNPYALIGSILAEKQTLSIAILQDPSFRQDPRFTKAQEIAGNEINKILQELMV